MQPGDNGKRSVKENIFHGGSVTSAVPILRRHGDVSDLHEKSRAELVELLDRQEKILKNSAFVEKLPDKGEKVRTFASKLRDLISDLDNENVAADHKELSQNRPEFESIQPKQEEDMSIIERGFEHLTVNDSPHYQVVVKAQGRERKKSKFSANRNAEKEGIHSSGPRKQTQGAKVPELTSASMHDPSHGPVKMISVDECRGLYSTQQQRMQESRAEQIADRLLRRMRMVTPSEHPEGKLRDHGSNEQAAALQKEYLDSID